MHAKKILQFLAALGLTALLLSFLFSKITLADLKQTFGLLSFKIVVVSFFLYALTNVFRAGRYYYLMHKRIHFKDMFALTCAHNMFVGLMPLRTGELSFPFLLRKRNIKVTHSLTSLGVGRVFDLYVVCAFFLVAMMFSYTALPPSIVHLTPYVIGIIIALIIISVLVMTHAMKVSEFLRQRKSHWLQWSGEKMREMVAGFREIHNPKTIAIVLVFSLLTWLVHFYWTYLLFASLFQINFWTIVAGSTLPTLSTALPVQGLGNFGTLELFWGYSFQAVGVEEKLAIASGFAFHFINILYFTILGVYGTIAFLRHRPHAKGST